MPRGSPITIASSLDAHSRRPRLLRIPPTSILAGSVTPDAKGRISKRVVGVNSEHPDVSPTATINVAAGLIPVRKRVIAVISSSGASVSTEYDALQTVG
jgi:hypothetical protein